MKTPNNRHNIKALLFDIVFDDERRARELYDDVRQLHYQELEKVISDCLDQFAGEGAFAELKVLEVDLGKIHYRDLESQLPEKLLVALTKKLNELFKGIPPGSRPAVMSTRSRLDLIRFYLEEAYLPWNGRKNVEELFFEALDEDPAGTAKLLKQLGRDARVRERLITRFGSFEKLSKIIRALIPHRSGLILDFYRHFLQLVRKHDHSPTGGRSLEIAIGRYLLNHLLLHTAAVEPALLIRSVLVQFSEAFRVPYFTLVSRWEKEVDSLPGTSRASLSEISRAITRGLPAYRIAEAERNIDFAQLSHEGKSRALWHFLRDGKIPDQQAVRPVEGRLEAHFQDLLQNESDSVIRFFQEAGATAGPVHRMVEHFSRAAILKLVEELNPGHTSLVVDCHENILLINRRASVVRISEKLFSDSLWVMILQVHLEKAGSHFNQKAFLKQLIRQIADHYNLSYFGLVDTLYRVANLLAGQYGKMPAFIQLITAVSREEQEYWHDAAPDPGEGVKSPDHPESNAATQKETAGETEEQRLALIKRYLHYPLDREQVQLVRKYLWYGRSNWLSTMLTEIKDPQLLAASLKKLTIDFEPAFIHRLVQTLEPAHFRAILDYQKQIIRVQKARPALQTSELELSSVLWQLILKILLSRKSSYFNRKYFLKQLLRQTAAHYNADFYALLDQFCEAAAMAKTSSPELTAFLQLIQKIQEEEQKKKRKQRTKTPASPVIPAAKILRDQDDFGGDTLLQLLLSGSERAMDALKTRGFFSRLEAIAHLAYYHRELLEKGLKRADRSSREAFINRLSPESTDLLWEMLASGRDRPVPKLVNTLVQRVEKTGIARQRALVSQLHREGLRLILQDPEPMLADSLNAFEAILDKYTLPPIFFDDQSDWKVPARGGLDRHLADLENRIKRSLAAEARRTSKTKLLLEDLAAPIGRSEAGIPYLKKKDEMIGQEIFITNAGLVILNAYLSFFFERCGLLGESGFASEDTARRGAQLLQYVLDPENSWGEEELVLNKLMCGLPLPTLISGEFAPSELEEEVSEQMLEAIISHWELVRNSSTQGFRESWLWREGKLTRKEKNWELLVEQRPYDVLLDYKPFSISPVSFSWMQLPINVIWR